MLELKLPEFNPQIKKVKGELYIFDSIRKKHLLLTPEEWVRQNFVNYLVTELSYPKALMRLESGLKYDQRQKRSDILIYNRESEPFLLVECKSMQIQLSQTTLEQVAQYNYILKSKYIVITNGIHFLAYQMNYENADYQLLSEMPKFSE